MSDIVRVLRLVEYVGERETVERQVQQSLHGTREFGKSGKGACWITVATIHEFPQAVEGVERIHIEQIADLRRQVASLHLEMQELRESSTGVEE